MKRLQQTGRALGSAVVLTLIVDDPATADGLFADLWNHIHSFEKQFSRFLPDSELTHFNQQAGQPVEVTKSFKRLLQTCQKFSQITDGLYNPFILPDLQKAGYVASWPKPDASTSQDYSHRQAAPIDQLIIKGDSAQIPVNSALDFGGIGKGYLLDELATGLKKQKVKAYWLSLGGDIVCAGNDLDGAPWQVAIANAQKPGEVVGHMSAATKGGAIATSGTTKRRGAKTGKQWHHIIDPRSGQPAQTDVVTASVSAATATEADVFAKCLVILGSQAAQQFAKQRALYSVILQTENGDILK